jgi:hypothetical protein
MLFAHLQIEKISARNVMATGNNGVVYGEAKSRGGEGD